MKECKIGVIPAAVWGEPGAHAVVAVHGSGSHKADAPIRLLAELAAERGMQVLSFDLPGHGVRPAGPCRMPQAVRELRAVMRYAREHWQHLDLFACSLGAYLSLLAYADAPLRRAWFLSPVVDMRRLLEDMMGWCGVTAAHLARVREIPTSMGQTLRWDEYTYVCAHPVDAWPPATRILRGETDSLCPADTIEDFVRRFGAERITVPGAAHYFHTPKDMQALRTWLAGSL